MWEYRGIVIVDVHGMHISLETAKRVAEALTGLKAVGWFDESTGEKSKDYDEWKTRAKAMVRINQYRLVLDDPSRVWERDKVLYVVLNDRDSQEVKS